VRSIYDRKVHRVRDLCCGDARIYLEFELRRVSCRRCGAVKQERLPWLADSPFYSKRFAFFVGRRCRTTTIYDVARELHLDWRAVKELDKQYMRDYRRPLNGKLAATAMAHLYRALPNIQISPQRI
jgi:transposase